MLWQNRLCQTSNRALFFSVKSCRMFVRFSMGNCYDKRVFWNEFVSDESVGVCECVWALLRLGVDA